MITVIVVSAIRLFRDGLAEILAGQSNIDLAGTFAMPAEAFEILEQAPPTVLLLAVPITEGPEVVRTAARIARSVKVVVLGVIESEAEVVSWAEAGVAGYVTREASGVELTRS